MGGGKALVTIAGRSLLARCAQRLARPGVERLIVVLGHEAERVSAAADAPESALYLRNAAFREGGMLSSILCGLDAAEDLGFDAVLLHPVDHPFVAEATVDRVVAALRDGAAIAAPSFEGRRGHPGAFARAVWPLLRAASEDRGARAVLHQNPERVVHVEGDAGCTAGIDTPADLARALALFAPDVS